MKKILLTLFVFLGLTGCALTENMDNTPTKKVEAFLNKYQTLDEDVLKDLDNLVVQNENFNNEQQELYKDIIKSNYQKMSYKIKDEEIDGEVATVTVEIDVVNYSRSISDANEYLKNHPEEFMTDNEYDDSLFIDYKLNQLKKYDEMITYTIDFSLSKVEDEWMLDSITDEIRNKINGNY